MWPVAFVFLGLLIGVTAIFDKPEVMRQNRFQSTSSLRASFETWADAQHFEGVGLIQVPHELKGLTFGRPVRYAQKGQIFWYLPHVSFVDNSEGLLYSPSGSPPPEDAFYQTKVVRQFDGHWFWITTT